jgi:hypothetical protein
MDDNRRGGLCAAGNEVIRPLERERRKSECEPDRVKHAIGVCVKKDKTTVGYAYGDIFGMSIQFDTSWILELFK